MALAEEHLSVPTTVLPTPGLPVHLIYNNTETVPSTPAKDNTTNLDLNNQDHRIQHISAYTNTQGATTPPSMSSPNLIPNDNGICVILSTTGPPDDFYLFKNLFGPSTSFTLRVKGNHLTLSLNLIEHPGTSRIKMKSCSPSTPVTRIPRW